MPEDLLSLFYKSPDLHQTPEYAKVMHGIGWMTIDEPGSQVFLRKLGPISVAKMQRPAAFSLERLKEIRKEYRTLTLFVEPALTFTTKNHQFSFPHTYEKKNPPEWLESMRKIGLHMPVPSFAHSATSIVDIRPSTQNILQSFKQKTRYNIHLSEKKGIRIESIPLEKLSKTQRQSFLDLREEWSRRKNVMGYEYQFMVSVLDGFKKQGTCHIAYKGKKPVATLLTLFTQHTSVYFSAFSTVEGYELQAPTLLTWKAMEYAKTCKKSIFDFGGIFDPRYKDTYKRWIGFTLFKARFNAIPLLYPPSHMQIFW
jgi:lipid II:glycine glycyltransferase (peptidoglycan interpeptide bridge formation enzyme)